KSYKQPQEPAEQEPAVQEPAVQEPAVQESAVQELAVQELAERKLAANLSCVFAKLVRMYNSIGLKKCKTKLVEIQMHLEDYSMCNQYYNQLIASNYFHHHLLNLNSQWYNPKWQVKSHDSETEYIEKQTCEIGIQVRKQLCEVGIQTSESIIQDLENYYKKCNTTNIDNRKCTCPNCNEKLDTLAALRAESTNESAQISNRTPN
ncbi:11618_t:CDS:2, partial [Dentiscutata heterogama]